MYDRIHHHSQLVHFLLLSLSFSPPTPIHPRKNAPKRLRDHADIGTTHIISAILNVAQDADEVWELHILDHDGRRHFIHMEAGDSESVCLCL